MKPAVKVRPISSISREEYIKLYNDWKELQRLSTKDNAGLIRPAIEKIKSKIHFHKYELLYQGKRIGTTTRDFVTLKRKVETLQRHIEDIQDRRRGARELEKETKTVLGYKFQEVGGLRVTPLNKIKREHHPKYAREYKKPVTKSNYIGIEIEMISDITLEQMALLLSVHKLDHKIRVMSDGSIRTEGDCSYAFEINIMDTEYNINNTLNKFQSLIENSGLKFRTNVSCGTHIHLDMRQRDADEVYSKLFNNLDRIVATVDSSRLDNKYCKRNIASDLDDALESYNSSAPRYQMINPEAVGKHNTLEVRVFEGTLNFDKIRNWIALCLEIINNNETKAVVNV